jgi:hypothetical protein
MDGQLVLTWIAIGVAGVYVLARVGLAWRGMRGGKSCVSGCGCPKSRSIPEQPPLIAPDQLKMRRR